MADPRDAERPETESRTAYPTTVLVVDDQPALGLYAAEVLATRGYQVLQAAGAEAALALAARHTGPLHLLLTDVHMPCMEGPELAARLLALRPGLRVLYMTGEPDRFALDPGQESARGLVVHKPFKAQDLLTAVGRTLNGAPPATPPSPSPPRPPAPHP